MNLNTIETEEESAAPEEAIQIVLEVVVDMTHGRTVAIATRRMLTLVDLRGIHLSLVIQ
jgi:hypothetical protein